VADNPAPCRAALARPDREVRLRFTGLIAAREPWERALDSNRGVAQSRQAGFGGDRRKKTSGWSQMDPPNRAAAEEYQPRPHPRDVPPTIGGQRWDDTRFTAAPLPDGRWEIVAAPSGPALSRLPLGGALVPVIEQIDAVDTVEGEGDASPEGSRPQRPPPRSDAYGRPLRRRDGGVPLSASIQSLHRVAVGPPGRFQIDAERQPAQGDDRRRSSMPGASGGR